MRILDFNCSLIKYYRASIKKNLEVVRTQIVKKSVYLNLKHRCALYLRMLV